MQTFDQHLFLMYRNGIITYDDAMRYASNKDEFKLKVQGVSTTSDMARDEMLQAAVGGARAAGRLMQVFLAAELTRTDGTVTPITDLNAPTIAPDRSSSAARTRTNSASTATPRPPANC